MRRSVVRAAGPLLAALAAVTCAGCGPTVQYVATDGKSFVPAMTSPEVDAVNASAEHDLQCPCGPITLQRVPGGRYSSSEYLADGCGQRATYRFRCDLSAPCRVLLMSRFPLDGGGLHASPKPP